VTKPDPEITPDEKPVRKAGSAAVFLCGLVPNLPSAAFDLPYFVTICTGHAVAAPGFVTSIFSLGQNFAGQLVPAAVFVTAGPEAAIAFLDFVATRADFVSNNL
jgi:hypothetical protein